MMTWEEFEPSGISAWISKINEDLKGKGMAKDFLYCVDDHIKLSPLIDKTDHFPEAGIRDISTKPGVIITSETTEEMNLRALKMLTNGAQVLLFKVDEQTEFSVLFSGIYLDMVQIFLDIDGDVNSVKSKLATYIKQYYNGKTTSIISIFPSALGILRLDESESFSERIVKVKDFFIIHNIAEADTEIFIFVALKNDFISQIAELRAIRLMSKNFLIGNLVKRLRIISEIGTKINIGATIHPLIIVNYKVLSAYLGMSDIVFGIPAGEDEELARLSLNIQHILKEESRITDVSDPVAGSYIIEKIASELIESVQ